MEYVNALLGVKPPFCYIGLNDYANKTPMAMTDDIQRTVTVLLSKKSGVVSLKYDKH
jgi:hypothetical protein